MAWGERKLLYEVNKANKWMYSHASLPIYYDLGENRYRVYFSTRDVKGRSFPAYVEFDRHTNMVLDITTKPLLDLGRIGTFDDSGIMGSSIVRTKDAVFLYYIGWTQRVSVPYNLAIGLAVSYDDGKHFEKVSEGPILDRSFEEPFFNTAPCVIYDDGIWKMWYVSCTEWLEYNNNMEPVYNVRNAQSYDGIHWSKQESKVCIDYSNNNEAIGRPYVIGTVGCYEMWFSYRKRLDYRNNPLNTYRIGYAVSKDGDNWDRKDDIKGLNVHKDGWDSQMTCYCNVYEYDNQRYILYNGNGFGKSGFGMARWEEK